MTLVAIGGYMTYAASLFFNRQNKLETSLLLPLRNVVLFPGITLPVLAGKPRSVAVVESTMLKENKQLIITAIHPQAVSRWGELETLQTTDDQNEAQKFSLPEIESFKEIYPIATLAVIHKITRLPGGLIQLIVEGLERVEIVELVQTHPTYAVKFKKLPALTEKEALTKGTDKQTLEALTQAIKSLWTEAAEINPRFPEELLGVLLSSKEPAQLAYQTSVLLQQDVTTSQVLLEEENLEKLLRQILTDLQKEIEVQKLQGEILGETKKEINQQQKEFFLREQLKKIQEELGETDPDKQEIAELRSRLSAADLPEVVEKQVKRELNRLERVKSASAEGGVIRTYLDWLLEMPWNQQVEDNLDLGNARTILDEDHYGLDKVKERIIEHLATFKLKKLAQQELTSPPATKIPTSYIVGTVICFAGPPGVGKTSLGKSIARTLGRPFERISLGGLTDEAELRGHRRTYIGAMPGRIVQALHRAEVKNPVIMLDELDKVGMDYRGDPASVLLEILDPQQNHSFRDLYLDLDFDLSQVLFIGTANDLSRVPPPLLDRLEIIQLSGYSQQEKLKIAQKYLLPRQITKAGLPNEALQLPESTISLIIEYYTHEAGVRKLEQQLGNLCRKIAVRYANGDTNPQLIHPEQLEELLGARQFLREEIRPDSKPGVATGLAWTLQGGEILFIEAVLLPQGKNLTLTGQLGEVMQESAEIARSYVWSQAKSLGIDLSVFKNNGLHIHVPAGAIPKDGPSAGVTMVVAIASLLMHHPVRNDTAMTGEVNLSGEVLPIGGVREKVLAAHQVGIKRVLLPRHNEKDLVDVPADVRQQIEFVFCDRIQQVLANALINYREVESNGANGNLGGTKVMEVR
ncbi:MAG: endopeptidase La [Xenococcaceae cyanobacterium MO_207.B15]|nr:endopeptidase La [Xenococcaceae cyanobacterium MO_207.B15]